jgi:hypothetical protein
LIISDADRKNYLIKDLEEGRKVSTEIREAYEKVVGPFMEVKVVID